MMKFIYIYIMVLLIFIGGCDNTVDPLTENKGNYSIYGYLDLNENDNFIRVKDLNRSLDETSEIINAEVKLENLDTGVSQILQDSIVEFEDVVTHNFYTTMNIKPNAQYKVWVEGSGGKSASATTTTPFMAETNVDPLGANCSTMVNINFEPVRSDLALNVEVGFYYNNSLFWVGVNTLLLEKENSVTLNSTPYTIINRRFDEKLLCENLSNDIFEVRYTHFGSGLYVNTFSDTLPGGVGKFGALYEDSFSFPIDTISLCPQDLMYCP